jgi:antitoxin (DNA-binding transcriptional repressor) of toxin-antitoxin stability system
MVYNEASNLIGGIALATVTIEEAQEKLAEIIHKLRAGDEVLITEGDQPVARIVAARSPVATQHPRQPGTLRGTVLYMAPDFDAPLEDFKEYME